MEVEIDGVKFKYLTENGFIIWAENWLAIEKLVKAGVVQKKFYQHCYGHVDYYYKP